MPPLTGLPGHSSFVIRHSSRSGVALIITLIMLAMITVMAVAFLALSRRERASVGQSVSSMDAELMTSAGLERAKAEILTSILAEAITNLARNTNFTAVLGPGLLVSGMHTNYAGDPRLLPNYYEDPEINASTANLDAISNLWHEARPPVFVRTNVNLNTPREPRFFVDLNRNGRCETNGAIEPLDANGLPITYPQGGAITNLYVGDPEWKGHLAHPDQPHSRNNRFVGRSAYLIQPIGLSLDLNWMHNDAGQQIGLQVAKTSDGYRRNQGVGPWELNLAAFIADLDPAYYGDPNGPQYDFRPFYKPGDPSSQGDAFRHARSLLEFRYGGAWTSLTPARLMFTNNALPFFTNDFVDSYLRLPPSPFAAPLTLDFDNPNDGWSGSDSQFHFFSLHELLRGPSSGTNYAYLDFANHLRSAGSRSQSSDDRYMLYRLLGQMGTDSAPEREDKINLNYKNNDGVSETNFIAWQPLEFFTNAAHRMLLEEFRTNRNPADPYWLIASNGLFKIPVVVANNTQFTNNAGIVQPYYSSRIHRVLQLAANIYDATTTSKTGEPQPFYPSVFRPQFLQQITANQTNLFIVGYTNEDRRNFAASVLRGTIPLHERTEPNIGSNDMVYGIPLIVGTKKGYPNFNEFAVDTIADFTRKLEIRKDRVGGRRIETNQMFIVGISNAFALEVWNSYDTNYPRDLNIVFTNVVTATLTNDAGFYTNMVFGGPTNAILSIPRGTFMAKQFRVPGGVNVNVVLPPSVYRPVPFPSFDPISSTNIFDRTGANYTNKWGMIVRNRLMYFLLDNGYIVDAVTGDDFSGDVDLAGLMSDQRNDTYGLWRNTLAGNVTEGVKNQIDVSRTTPPISDWNSYDASPISGNDATKSIEAFQIFLGFGPTNGAVSTNLAMQAPFTPTRRIRQTSHWEANDPIVHYLSDDLRELQNGILTNTVFAEPMLLTQPIMINDPDRTTIGEKNHNYKPWPEDPVSTGIPDKDIAMDIRIKDSGVISSDRWNFPSGKFPSVGWLGRVHRGTPWQTVYLKAYPVDADAPDRWLASDGGPGLSRETHPTNDWKFIDLFTTAIHPNATRGRLSVNQTNFAAWSAVLSSISVSTLNRTFAGDVSPANTIIEPAAVKPSIITIIDAINRQRDQRPGKRFEHLGEILSVPELTVASPYLNPPLLNWDPGDVQADKRYYLSDLDYERIPDAILSLLKLGEPRYVIYAFGQSLKPAPNSIITAGPHAGLCVNYQITGELATRSVVRVDFDKVTDPSDPRYPGPDVNRPHIVVEQFNILPAE